MEIKYFFGSVSKERDSSYLLQITNGRRLSDICHSHDFYEITFLLDGACTQSVNGTAVSMKSGDFCILSPGDRHTFLQQSENANLFALSVEAAEFSKFAQAYGITEDIILNTHVPKVFSAREEYGRIAERAALCTRGEEREQERKLLLSLILKCCACRKSADGMLLPQELGRMVSGMRSPENLRRGIEAMEDLSRYSHTHLSRLMKRYMGTSPHAYLLQARMQAAYAMLSFSSESPEDISEGIGYKSFSHFHRIFKETFGLTPKEVQKKNRIQTV